MRECRRQRRPAEHAGARRRNVPAGAAKAFDQHVAAAVVKLAVALHDILRAVDRRHGRSLNGGEGAIIEIGFDPGQRGDERFVADRETDAPARHRIGFRHRGELDRDILGTGHLQDRRRRLPVEIDFRISEIGQYPDLVLFGEGDDSFVKGQIDRFGGRVRRITHDQHRRLGHGELHGAFQRFEIAFVGCRRHAADGRASDDEAKGVDGVAGVGCQHDIAGRGDRLGEVGEAFL